MVAWQPRRAVNRAMGMAVAAVVISCGPTLHTSMSTTDRAEYPCVLHDPSTLHPDFMVRQTVAVHAVADGKSIHRQFDAVLQKQGDTLLMIGLGPANVKGFTLQQKDDRSIDPTPHSLLGSAVTLGNPWRGTHPGRAGVIEFKQFMGPALPFSPRNMLVDVHRVYFKRLPPRGDGAPDTGVRRGELDGEMVEETWKDGNLRSVMFTRPDHPELHGAIRIEMGPGCQRNACAPDAIQLQNEWFHYRLEIINGDYERL